MRAKGACLLPTSGRVKVHHIISIFVIIEANIAVRDGIFWGMEDFDFAQIQLLCPNPTKFAPKSNQFYQIKNNINNNCLGLRQLLQHWKQIYVILIRKL